MRDYLEDRAANHLLIQKIVSWWARRGYTVRAWIEKATDPITGGKIWVIRTNIVQDVRVLPYMVD